MSNMPLVAKEYEADYYNSISRQTEMKFSNAFGIVDGLQPQIQHQQPAFKAPAYTYGIK